MALEAIPFGYVHLMTEEEIQQAIERAYEIPEWGI